MNNEFLKVKPVIVYPYCLKNGLEQDCFKCELHIKDLCKSPRGLCTREYPGQDHKKGCPNYGKNSLCPPNVPMYDQIFNINKDIYLIYTTFPLGLHMRKMKEKYPDWSERQLRNVIYWQKTAKRIHKEKIIEFLNLYKDLKYIAVTPEAFGVDVTKTLKSVGIDLSWPPIEDTYRVSLAAEPLSYDYCFFENRDISYQLKK